MKAISPRNALQWAIVSVSVVGLAAAAAAVVRDLWRGTFPALTALVGSNSSVPQALILVIACAAIATIVVLALRATRGTLEFRALGVSFTGPSGPILLWIASFLAVAVATRIFLVRATHRGPPVVTVTADDSLAKALLLSDISEAYKYSSRQLFFFADWGRPPTIQTLRVDKGSLSFSANGGTVSTSVDPLLMPATSNYSPALAQTARLTPGQAALVARFLSSYAQLRGALEKLSSSPAHLAPNAFIDATSIARETTNRGREALCGLGQPLPKAIPTATSGDSIPCR